MHLQYRTLLNSRTLYSSNSKEFKFLSAAILKYDINDLKAFKDHSGDSESKNDKDN